MPQPPAVHHDHQRRRWQRRFGRVRGGQRRPRRQADLGLLLGARARPLHLLMNHRIIHHHAPTRDDGGGWGVGSRRDRRETKFLGQPRRDFLMRHQSPRPLLGTKPFLRARVPARNQRSAAPVPVPCAASGAAACVGAGGKTSPVSSASCCNRSSSRRRPNSRYSATTSRSTSANVANGLASFFRAGLIHRFLPVRNRFASHGKNSVKMHPRVRACHALLAKTDLSMSRANASQW